MFTLGPIGFVSPLILWGLVILPLLWFLLRAVPPAPVRQRFPAVALLLGLGDEDAETDRTPWWLLLLRMLAVAAAIIGFAGPVLNQEERQPGTGPLLLVMDAGWADARDWTSRAERARQMLEEAGRDGRPVAVIALSEPPQDIVFQTADALAPRLGALQPNAWAPGNFALWAEKLPQGGFDTLWFSDGIAHEGRFTLSEALAARGHVRVIESDTPVLALHPPEFIDGKIRLSVSRSWPGPAASVEVLGRGPDPSAVERELMRVTLGFAEAEARATLEAEVPPELRNRITRFEIVGPRSAGAISLADDSLRRRKVALVASGPAQEGLQLLSPLHYLRQALAPVADLIEGSLPDVLPAAPDVVVLADVARLGSVETEALQDWLEKGGLLLRFAGPRLAAVAGTGNEDALLPVPLRQGGRQVGGAMSWGEPKSLAPFAEGSPFHGLALPEELEVREQVLAQPDPDLAERTIAALEDGTPLVTRRAFGSGAIVLFHVTANAEWSNLPISGLFVQMLERLAVSSRAARPEAGELVGQLWQPEVLLDAWGEERDAGEVAGVAGAVLAEAIARGPGAAAPPGLYAGKERRVALNVIGPRTELSPAVWPTGVAVEGLARAAEQSLEGPFLAGAILILLLDIVASLWLGGRLGRIGRRALPALLALALLPAPQARAQMEEPLKDAFGILATDRVTLAYVMTGDAAVDELSEHGLTGLGDVLWARTAVEPAPPMGIDLETDELAFFPFLYWPITADAKPPSAAAYARLNQFLRTGGMILFDTRDADVTALGAGSPEGEALQRIAAGLDIPPLEPIPPDHVLTRTFYLLQDFPGRQSGGTVWVEAAPDAEEAEEGMPFRQLNDGVTPVVIGGNDWAAAWALDDNGVPMVPVGRGAAGDQQREMAWRFGVNLIMHALTGNYKSDQVHVPALLERLGQ